MKKRDNILRILGSLLLGVFLSIKSFNQILMSYIYGSESLMSLLYIIVVSAIILVGVFSRGGTHRLNSNSFIILVYLLLLFYITYLTGGKPYTPFSFFFVFTICSFVIPFFIQIDIKVVLKTIMVLSIPSIFRIGTIFISAEEFGSISMGLSYAFLIPVVAAIVYVFYFYKEENFLGKLITWISAFSCLLIMVQLVSFGVRGPILSILSLLLFLFSFSICQNGDNGIRIKNKRLFISLCALLLLIYFFMPFLEYISIFLSKSNSNLYFIEKMLRLSAEGDITNGRAGIFDIVMDAFFSRPIFGNGFDLFGTYGPYEYPHNFIYQILCDGGLVMVLLVLIPVIQNTIAILKYGEYQEIIFFSFLFFASVPGALFSGDLWQNAPLWLLSGYSMSVGYQAKKTSR